ncbi:MAG: hydrogenase expression/formation protein [Promethearchaeota archaeon]|nr:MAG: hydrogenase expression/formation protein [Candidatus Lokiarchaeota archaeon]
MTPPKTSKFYSVGKLNHNSLEKLIKDYVSDLAINDKRVVSASKIGEDAAVIDQPGDSFLVVKTDPITFATEEIGYYVVNVNVNDVVCTGAIPKWFQSTVLLPEKGTTEELVSSIFKSIHDTCESFGITVIGGHTEVTSGIGRPIVVGSLLGEVKKDKLVLSSGAEPGDSLVLTKGVFIEGTSIIAREKRKLLEEKGFKAQFIKQCQDFLFNPGISVYEEARLATKNFRIKAMHDPTEGGLSCGIAELAIASEVGVLIEQEKINILPESQELSKIFDLNPLGTISSGSLLIVVEKEDVHQLITLLRQNKIEAMEIGNFIEKDKGFLIKDREGKIEPLEYSETDEITKLYQE